MAMIRIKIKEKMVPRTMVRRLYGMTQRRALKTMAGREKTFLHGRFLIVKTRLKIRRIRNLSRHECGLGGIEKSPEVDHSYKKRGCSGMESSLDAVGYGKTGP
jgi:hypothetical protein